MLTVWRFRVLTVKGRMGLGVKRVFGGCVYHKLQSNGFMRLRLGFAGRERWWCMEENESVKEEVRSDIFYSNRPLAVPVLAPKRRPSIKIAHPDRFPHYDQSGWRHRASLLPSAINLLTKVDRPEVTT